MITSCSHGKSRHAQAVLICSASPLSRVSPPTDVLTGRGDLEIMGRLYGYKQVVNRVKEATCCFSLWPLSNQGPHSFSYMVVLWLASGKRK